MDIIQGYLYKTAGEGDPQRYSVVSTVATVSCRDRTLILQGNGRSCREDPGTTRTKGIKGIDKKEGEEE